MNPKSGKKIKPVKPGAPKVAEDADDDSPGGVASATAKPGRREKGNFGSTNVKPFVPPQAGAGAADSESAAEEPPEGWIEVEMVGEDGSPIAGERYEITVPDGRVASGTLDGNGFARVEGFEPGECKITFPDLDKDAWEPA
ncbi:MAG: hypothetical protein AAGG11_01170 [Pseudomonadota bacterium]